MMISDLQDKDRMKRKTDRDDYANSLARSNESAESGSAKNKTP
jgi:hypothetical protein